LLKNILLYTNSEKERLTSAVERGRRANVEHIPRNEAVRSKNSAKISKNLLNF
jgi:hypothetical protein